MISRLALLILATTGWLLVNVTAADDNTEKTRKLIAVLQSDAPFYDKARACQQLGEIGDRQAVPALAAQLADEHLNAYARSGLEGIPDPSAAAALRTAAGTLRGKTLAGVIHSLGVLRDVEAVGLLKKYVDDSAAGVVKDALLALGNIATDEAIAPLQQVLAKGAEADRAEAASACLLAAEQQYRAGRLEVAAALNDAVRRASVSGTLRAAATRGAIVARQAKGVPLLLEQIRSPERILRHAALLAVREIPSDTLARALNAELDRAAPELQVQLLTALVDCHNPASLAAVQARISSENAEVRKTALTVLGRIGGKPAAQALIRVAVQNPDREEAGVALDSLRQMEGTAADAPITEALSSVKDTGTRVQFIRMLEQRAVVQASGELLKFAADSDAKISVAALRALKSLAGADEVSALIALTKSSADAAVREAAENAVVGACTRSDRVASGSDAVLAELKSSSDPAVKLSWIRILVSLGHAKALPALLSALRDTQESVALGAMEQLARWHDPSPVDELLAVVRSAANSARRQRALNSVIALATAAADEHQRPDAAVVAWFQQANQAARTTAQRRLIISGLSRVKHRGSFQLLRPYLDDAALSNEAAVAVLQIAPALLKEEPAALKQALEKIRETTQNAQLRNQATQLIKSIP
jgi:HEAT repeat protein